jgi:serine/threonine protein kinase
MGCIAYNLITGATPFSQPTEWLTLECITKRFEQNAPIDYPESVNEDAKDMIERLLASTPSERLGAGSSDSQYSMAILKAHPFFQSEEIVWGELVNKGPPYIPDSSTFPSTRNSDMHDGAHDEWLLEGEATIIDSESYGKRRSYNANEDDEEKRTVSDTQWNIFFEPNEQLVFTGLVWKRKVNIIIECHFQYMCHLLFIFRDYFQKVVS